MKKLLITKRGSTSIIVTIFAMLLFSIIVVGFVRLTLSEAGQTSNSDLSKSAYDSALAGVEDAKVALLKYHECLNRYQEGGSDTNCKEIIEAMQNGIKNQDCNTVANVLSRTTDEQKGVTIQEVKNKNLDQGRGADMMQAYTCVTLQEDLSDYRSSLSSENRLRIVPIRSDKIKELKYVNIKWFSDTNYAKLLSNGHQLSWSENASLPSGQYSLVPPLINASFYQADKNFKMSDLITASGDNSTDQGTMYLRPSKNGTNEIRASEVSRTFDKHKNELFYVKCQEGNFFCSLTFEVPNTFHNSNDRNTGATFLVLSLRINAPNITTKIISSVIIIISLPIKLLF
jgi:Tfp pilus assembly protein PilX